MPDLEDGARVTVQGSGSNQYELAREGRVYSCSCPAWRNMRMPIVNRRCKHLIAYLGGLPLAQVTPRENLARRPFEPSASQAPLQAYDEPPARRATRDAALANALDLHVVLFDKMEETYGLRLPRDVAWTAGFVLALDDAERTALARAASRGMLGAGAWFLPDGLDARGDPRLRDRADDDPPELVPLMSGAEDDERYCALYDEPSELPVGIVLRKGAQTRTCKATLLETLRERLFAFPGTRDATLAAIMSWLDEVLRRRSLEPDEESPLSFQGIAGKRGSFPNPYVPGWRFPDDLAGAREHDERHAAYAADAPIVDEWVAQARDELGEGAPGRALFLGRELHMTKSAALRGRASELLIRAYAMLGRGALLDTVRAQHHALHPEIPLYELPPPHLVVLAAADDDAAAVARAWAHSPPNESDVEEALKRAASVEVFDAIFERVELEDRDRACRGALGRKLSQMTNLPHASRERAALRVLIGRFVERSSLDARAFERILGAKEPELAEKAATTVDLASTARGETPLHLAARALAPTLVRTLVARGADVRAKNAKGRMAFDDAAAAAHFHAGAREAHAIMRMLEAAGGGVGKVPTLAFAEGPVWLVGDAVHHAKFGDGVVEKVVASDDDTKLQIRFGKKDVKVLLQKFVTRR